ncbi:hypothetical protein SNEBB_004431 [Seison nebaliae]|nr:hypothetical protein SNEBB_004431 [Seison nebaliae]
MAHCRDEFLESTRQNCGKNFGFQPSNNRKTTPAKHYYQIAPNGNLNMESPKDQYSLEQAQIDSEFEESREEHRVKFMDCRDDLYRIVLNNLSIFCEKKEKESTGKHEEFLVPITLQSDISTFFNNIPCLYEDCSVQQFSTDIKPNINEKFNSFRSKSSTTSDVFPTTYNSSTFYPSFSTPPPPPQSLSSTASSSFNQNSQNNFRLRQRRETSAPLLPILQDDMVCSVCFAYLPQPKMEQKQNNEKKMEKDKVHLRELRYLVCSSCGISVHTHCYGTSGFENAYKSWLPSFETDITKRSIWFCDVCKAGLRQSNLNCIFCPIRDCSMAMKQTNTGEWVHMCCAFFHRKESILHECSQYSIHEQCIIHLIDVRCWNEKVCSLCEENSEDSRMGLTMQCEAGACKTFFHVSCAQKRGLIESVILTNSTPVDSMIFCLEHHQDENHRNRFADRYEVALETLIEFQKKMTNCLMRTVIHAFIQIFLYHRFTKDTLRIDTDENRENNALENGGEIIMDNSSPTNNHHSSGKRPIKRNYENRNRKTKKIDEGESSSIDTPCTPTETVEGLIEETTNNPLTSNEEKIMVDLMRVRDIAEFLPFHHLNQTLNLAFCFWHKRYSKNIQLEIAKRGNNFMSPRGLSSSNDSLALRNKMWYLLYNHSKDSNVLGLDTKFIPSGEDELAFMSDRLRHLNRWDMPDDDLNLNSDEEENEDEEMIADSEISSSEHSTRDNSVEEGEVEVKEEKVEVKVKEEVVDKENENIIDNLIMEDEDDGSYCWPIVKRTLHFDNDPKNSISDYLTDKNDLVYNKYHTNPNFIQDSNLIRSSEIGDNRSISIPVHRQTWDDILFEKRHEYSPVMRSITLDRFECFDDELPADDMRLLIDHDLLLVYNPDDDDDDNEDDDDDDNEENSDESDDDETNDDETIDDDDDDDDNDDDDRINDETKNEINSTHSNNSDDEKRGEETSSSSLITTTTTTRRTTSSPSDHRHRRYSSIDSMDEKDDDQTISSVSSNDSDDEIVRIEKKKLNELQKIKTEIEENSKLNSDNSTIEKIEIFYRFNENALMRRSLIDLESIKAYAKARNIFMALLEKQAEQFDNECEKFEEENEVLMKMIRVNEKCSKLSTKEQTEETKEKLKFFDDRIRCFTFGINTNDISADWEELSEMRKKVLGKPFPPSNTKVLKEQPKIKCEKISRNFSQYLINSPRDMMKSKPPICPVSNSIVSTTDKSKSARKHRLVNMDNFEKRKKKNESEEKRDIVNQRTISPKVASRLEIEREKPIEYLRVQSNNLMTHKLRISNLSPVISSSGIDKYEEDESPNKFKRTSVPNGGTM